MKVFIDRIDAQTGGVKMHIGQKILSEHKLFESHQMKKRKSQTAAFNIEYVCDQIRQLKLDKFVHFTQK